MRFCGRYRVNSRQQLLQLCGTVAMVMFCCYGLFIYVDIIRLEAAFLHPTSVPTLYQNDHHVKKLAELSKQYSDLTPIPSKAVTFSGLTYEEVLARLTSPQNQIILALIDGGFLQMALNFYITCIRAFDIRNYLFLASDQASCDRLLAVGIHCFVYRRDESWMEASVYRSPSFLRKMNIRTAMILDALREGYEVVHTDVDMFCHKNMLENLDCTDCDLAALLDKVAYNAGLVHVRPTKFGTQVYAEMQKMVDQNTTLDDQKQLNNVIESMQWQSGSSFKVKYLGSGYQCGQTYYEDEGPRFFATDPMLPPCPECILVHNNWIVSMEAKVYRAKEMHQWMYDENQYYTSTTRKYLVYDNPLVGRYMNEIEKEALKNALAIGQVLNRTVILPKFHCYRAHCPLNSLLNIAKFDKLFGGAYREHSFLAHPLVPAQIRNSIYGPVMVMSEYLVFTSGPDLDLVARQQEVLPNDPKLGMTDVEVKGRFGHVTDQVLRFFALYNVFDRFENPTQNEEFLKKIAYGFIEDSYMQNTKRD